MKKFLIIGSPISHSMSPKIHNYWFKENNIDANFEKKEPKKSEIQNIITKIKSMEIHGMNVTVPYKQEVIQYLETLSEIAKKTNSVNTIFLDDSNRIVGENTDVFGLQAGYLKEINNIEQKSVLVIGAGGVSPSIIFSLQKSKIKNISIINRTHEKSIFLKKKFNFLNILEWKSLRQEICNFDIIIFYI